MAIEEGENFPYHPRKGVCPKKSKKISIGSTYQLPKKGERGELTLLRPGTVDKPKRKKKERRISIFIIGKKGGNPPLLRGGRFRVNVKKETNIIFGGGERGGKGSLLLLP